MTRAPAMPHPARAQRLAALGVTVYTLRPRPRPALTAIGIVATDDAPAADDPLWRRVLAALGASVAVVQISAATVEPARASLWLAFGAQSAAAESAIALPPWSAVRTSGASKRALWCALKGRVG